MLRLVNRYCSNCLRTQRFLDLGAHLVCVCCTKRLDRARPEPVTIESPVVAWGEGTERRRLRCDAG